MQKKKIRNHKGKEVRLTSDVLTIRVYPRGKRRSICETLEERQEPTSQTDFHTHIHVRIWKISLTRTFPKCLVEK